MASPPSLTPDEFRLLTWSRPELTRMTIQVQSLQRHCPLDNGRLQQSTVFEAKCTASPSNIGDLEAFPIEIIHSVFNILDLQSLTNSRAISWRARALVDSFPQVKSSLIIKNLFGVFKHHSHQSYVSYPGRDLESRN